MGLILKWAIPGLALMTLGTFLALTGKTEVLSSLGSVLVIASLPILFFASLFAFGKQTPNTLELVIHDLSNHANTLHFKWPDSKPGLWTGLYDPYIAPSLSTSFLMANTPIGHKVYFAVAEWAKHPPFHHVLKPMLESSKEPYSEMLDDRNREQWTILFSATRNAHIIETIFEDYSFYYGSFITFPFIVAGSEPANWKDKLLNLMREGWRGVSPEMIEDSHCILQTAHEHGIEMITDKIARSEVVRTASDIARQQAIPLNVSELEQPRDLAGLLLCL